MANNIEKSYRELQRDARTSWARRSNLHRVAIDYAGRYVNLDNQMLQLISDYENAAEMPPGPPRESAMARAWVAVIMYMRLLNRRDSEAA